MITTRLRVLFWFVHICPVHNICLLLVRIHLQVSLVIVSHNSIFYVISILCFAVYYILLCPLEAGVCLTVPISVFGVDRSIIYIYIYVFLIIYLHLFITYIYTLFTQLLHARLSLHRLHMYIIHMWVNIRYVLYMNTFTNYLFSIAVLFMLYHLTILSIRNGLKIWIYNDELFFFRFDDD